MKKLSKEWVRQLWAQVYTELYLPDPQGFRLTQDERHKLETRNNTYKKPVLGEIEVRDRLNWGETYDHWTWIKISELMEKADIKGTSSVQVGKVLAMLAKEDWRIKVKIIHGVKSYYLPPILNSFSHTGSIDDKFRVPDEE